MLRCGAFLGCLAFLHLHIVYQDSCLLVLVSICLYLVSLFVCLFYLFVCLLYVCFYVCLFVLRKLSKLSPNHGDLDRLFDLTFKVKSIS